VRQRRDRSRCEGDEDAERERRTLRDEAVATLAELEGLEQQP